MEIKLIGRNNFCINPEAVKGEIAGIMERVNLFYNNIETFRNFFKERNPEANIPVEDISLEIDLDNAVDEFCVVDKEHNNRVIGMLEIASKDSALDLDTSSLDDENYKEYNDCGGLGGSMSYYHTIPNTQDYYFREL